MIKNKMPASFTASRPAVAPVAEAEKNEAGRVKFLIEQQWLIRMKLGKAEEQTVSKQITTVGRVVPVANSQAVVSTPVAGVLSDRPLPTIGQFVSAGQPVAVIRQTATSAKQAQKRGVPLPASAWSRWHWAQAEPGKEIQQPMAVVTLGGIITSTFLNMIVIPALYLKYGVHEDIDSARDSS